jgi:hypothetical protein
LERTAVLKAICSGFKETTDPPVCLSSGWWHIYSQSFTQDWYFTLGEIADKFSLFPWCLLTELETNECLERNGGCWQDRESNTTACKVIQKKYSNMRFFYRSPHKNCLVKPFYITCCCPLCFLFH